MGTFPLVAVSSDTCNFNDGRLRPVHQKCTDIRDTSNSRANWLALPCCKRNHFLSLVELFISMHPPSEYIIGPRI